MFYSLFLHILSQFMYIYPRSSFLSTDGAESFFFFFFFFFSFRERGGKGNKSFTLKEVSSQVQLLTRLPYNFSGQKRFPFCIAPIAKIWYSFQMPSLELKRVLYCPIHMNKMRLVAL